MAFSVYIHLPYCLRKCPYCDFNTYAVTRFPERRYTDALAREIEAAAADPTWSGRHVDTVFFGGGTPSLFEPASVGALLELIGARFGITAEAEITMEANPGSLEGAAEEKLTEFRAAGINRLSTGAQSFDPRHLQTLGRLHTPQDTVAAIRGARRAGFDNLSCDLIFAIPGQSLSECRDDLMRLIDFAPEHVSAYNLTYEKGTPISGLRAAGMIEAADEETERAMYEHTIELLAEAGYRHYEISNFARAGRHSRHNLAYWTWSDYLGLGAGAHGFARCNDAAQVWGVRYANVRLPETYMSAGPGDWAESRELIDRHTAIAEFTMLGLRLLDGIAEADFQAAFQCHCEDALPALGFLTAKRLVDRDDGQLRLTREGLMLADSVISRLAGQSA